MKQRTPTRLGLLAASVAMIFGLSTGSALAGAGLNPDADEVLRSMSEYLAGVQSFSFEADVSNEILTKEGQKLQLNSHATVAIERPARLRMSRKGRFADVELSYDGSAITLYGKQLNAYAQMPFTGSVDEALRAVERETGLPLPGVDLLLLDSHAVLTSGATESGYYGRAWVGGVETHHLAFRTAQVDLQVWVDAGDEPLPRKYVITTKWTTGAPQYSVQLRDWNTRARFDADAFAFSPPADALQLEALPVDATGEIVVLEETQ
jgi:hypothetical protein